MNQPEVLVPFWFDKFHYNQLGRYENKIYYLTLLSSGSIVSRCSSILVCNFWTIWEMSSIALPFSSSFCCLAPEISSSRACCSAKPVTPWTYQNVKIKFSNKIEPFPIEPIFLFPWRAYGWEFPLYVRVRHFQTGVLFRRVDSNSIFNSNIKRVKRISYKILSTETFQLIPRRIISLTLTPQLGSIF